MVTAVRLFPQKPYLSNLSAHSFWLISFQALLIFGSLCLAWLLRFDFSLPNPLLLFAAAPILLMIRLVALAHFRLLHGWWRYTGLKDVVDILKAITLGSAVFLIVMRVILGASNFPRSIYLLEPLVSAASLIGVRGFCRMLNQSVRHDGTLRRAMLIGAGFAAEMVIREMVRPRSGYRIVGCVDDDPSKLGIHIHGVPVIGNVDQLPTLVAAHAVDEILIAVPSATGARMQRFARICEQAGIPFKTVPALQDIINGRVSINHFREVRLEDLLGREPVEMDLRSVRKQIEGHVVLVTGAAGTIGSELCRQILEYDPSELLCVDQSETGIFYLEIELSERNKNGSQLLFHVGDVGDSERMRNFVAEHRPRVVFHAAAYKHVPIMEWNVHGAVKNNVFALLTLLDLAEQGGCQSFVLISSDKAVNPTSIMGATKRVGELIIAARPTTSMRCVSVRFGNVLGSNGSVVPVFQQQLRNHQPLTITHPEIRRFFMTTREAVSLVLQAFAIGDHSDTLVLDMGTPVRIFDLARMLIRLSGMSEDDVQIKFTGLREGEKLFEELFYAWEDVEPTPFQKIRRIPGIPNRWFELHHHLEELRVATTLDSSAAIRTKIKEIVPEYTYGSGHEENGDARNSQPGPKILEHAVSADSKTLDSSEIQHPLL